MRFLLKLFSDESAFGRFLNRLYILITSNLLFVLFSVPVVTIGASLCALNYTLMKLQRGDRHFKVAATFWKGFKENFRKATIAFVVLVAVVMLQALEISWCRQFSGPMAMFTYVLYGLLFIEAILAIYLFPVIAAFNGGFKELIEDTLYFSFSKPFSMLLCLLLHAVPLFVTYSFLTYLPLWAFLWMIGGFAFIAYGSTHIMLRQFKPFLPEVDIAGDIIPPGMEDDPNILVADENSDDADDEPDEKTLREMMKYGL